MNTLITIMILAGSALMVYNIIRYGMFVKTMNDLEHHSRMRGLLIVPLLLLVFFLIGYIIVGLSGIADLIEAGILLGGSIFVSIMLYVMYTIISRMRDTDEILSSRYDEMKDELDAMTKDSLAVFRVNLTRDEIEERAGTELYDSDLASDSYSEIMSARSRYIVDPTYYETNEALFTREGLLDHYQEGQTNASEVLLVRRKNGEVGFVRLEARLTKKAVSGDIVAFITERPFDRSVVRNILLNDVMLDRFDRIAYLINGRYRVVASNDGRKTNLLLPADVEGTYEDVYLNYILPAFPKDRVRPAGQPNPLRLSVIDKALAENPVYEYTGPFLINGERLQKQVSFYRVDTNAKYYIMLISDTTKAHEEYEKLLKMSSDGSVDRPAETTEPPKEPVAAEPEAPSVPNVPGPEKPVFVRPLRLLLVDDNPVNREIGELLLTAEGFTVDLAGNGKEAVDRVALAEAAPYDAVLMDIRMPVLDGCEAAKAIRRLPDPVRAAVPIIALSAGNSREDAKEAVDAGMNAYASKPIEPVALSKLLAEFVSAELVSGKGGNE